MIEHVNLIGKVTKIMQSSKGMIKFIRVLKVVELTIIIQGRIVKIVIDVYLKCDNILYYGKNFSQKSHTIKIINIINIVVRESFMISLVVMDAFEKKLYHIYHIFIKYKGTQ